MKTLLLFPLLCAAAACTTIRLQTRTAAQWQQVARGDLDAAHALVMASHPGAIDEQNPRFRETSEQAYRAALQLIAQIDGYDAMMAVVSSYTTAFHDGHLVYSDNIRKGHYPVRYAGWHITSKDGSYFVNATMDGWGTAQPRVGSQLLSCDGQSPSTIIRDRIAPFHDRRKEMQTAVAWNFGVAALPALQLKRCTFLEAGGPVDYRLAYRQVPTDDYFQFVHSIPRPAAPERSNSYSMRDGTVWIRAANFYLQPESSQAAELDKMLGELSNLKGVQRIVFDARGNGGGDSRIGQQIFEAATGGLHADVPDQEKLVQTYAQWRVSPMALDNAEGHVRRMHALHGHDSVQVAAARHFRDQLTQARDAGLPWLHVASGPRLTRDDIARHGGKLRRFSGGVRIALVTDGNCASACLDFADMVRMVPGMKHVGQTTAYDSVYIDVGVQDLPSGNALMVPLKVWRNRLRANNEALVPDTIFDVDMSDDQAVYDATLAVLK